MNSREQTLNLADYLEGALRDGGSLNRAEAQLCAEGLRMLADNEARFEVAEIIERATGRPWHDPRVIRAAGEITRLLDRRPS